MTDEEILMLKNALNNDYAFKFIFFMLNKLGAFERGINCNANEKEIYRTIGKREQGLWLLDQILKTDENKFFEIMKLRKEELNK